MPCGINRNTVLVFIIAVKQTGYLKHICYNLDFVFIKRSRLYGSINFRYNILFGSDSSNFTCRYGRFHFSCSGCCSWYCHRLFVDFVCNSFTVLVNQNSYNVAFFIGCFLVYNLSCYRLSVFVGNNLALFVGNLNLVNVVNILVVYKSVNGCGSFFFLAFIGTACHNCTDCDCSRKYNGYRPFHQKNTPCPC